MLDYFDLKSETAIQPISKSDYNESIENLDGQSIDSEGKTKNRAEQGFLRNSLFGNEKIAECGICGKVYPISFLVAAHIKKRSFYSNEKKLDVRILLCLCVNLAVMICLRKDI
ncbi:hypothetical protein [Priestia megaterium]|uniref:hypothetical protein n=1 Tax=Priestia megaterium TaxID=1404 RepID=UPI002E1F2E86|nr:hypothetical protein [Priestia megaterium]